MFSFIATVYATVTKHLFNVFIALKYSLHKAILYYLLCSLNLYIFSVSLLLLYWWTWRSFIFNFYFVVSFISSSKPIFFKYLFTESFSILLCYVHYNLHILAKCQLVVQIEEKNCHFRKFAAFPELRKFSETLM